MRGWYNRKTLKERREWIARRDPALVRAGDRARYERDKGKRQALAKKWARENPEKIREIGKRWNEANPEKKRVHSIVAKAVRSGKLIRQPCEICGDQIVHAHHDDYSKPLEVRWLCPSHHSQHHGLMQRID
jgi:ribosomal protein S27AE